MHSLFVKILFVLFVIIIIVAFGDTLLRHFLPKAKKKFVILLLCSFRSQ